MSLAVGIVAHLDRTQQVAELIELLNACGLNESPNVSWDDGTLGAYGNHRRLLTELARTPATHVVVLEDDALPCAGFIELLNGYMAERPDHLLGLYVGRRRPADIQVGIACAVAAADQAGARWLDFPQRPNHRSLRWGVGYVVPIVDIPEVLTCADELPGLGADRRIGRWHGEQGRVSYPWPSLVDHRDDASLVGRRAPGRRAWRTHQMPGVTDGPPGLRPTPPMPSSRTT